MGEAGDGGWFLVSSFLLLVSGPLLATRVQYPYFNGIEMVFQLKPIRCGRCEKQKTEIEIRFKYLIFNKLRRKGIGSFARMIFKGDPP
jgi:hypothetical protein